MNKTLLAARYLDLLKASLLDELYVENEARLLYTFNGVLNNQPLELNQYLNITRTQAGLIDSLRNCKRTGLTPVLTMRGDDGAIHEAPDMRNVIELSHTMVGRKRLENVQYCVETVLADGIGGDLIETGVWRGGTCIFMEGLLVAHEATDRTVWAADSFAGVPPPTWPQDKGFDLSPNVFPVLAVSVAEVRELFDRYGLLKDNVRFLEGWFKDTLATAPIERLAVLRLDGDLYESTMDALAPLYDKVSSGGFVIVDDYGSCPPCKQAVDDFRARHGIAEPMLEIDIQSVYWRKN